MEWKIGEIKQINNEWYQSIPEEHDCCTGCAFLKDRGFCHSSPCSFRFRCDGKSVIFKKLEKVGEPYEYFIQGMGVIMVQEYILANANYIWEYSQDVVVMDCQNGKVAIEIKQTKEDMGKYRRHDAKKDIPDKEKPNLKPFNLEQAKAGKPVCTRDGRKARIICFDAKGDYPIVALIERLTENGNIEGVEQYAIDGHYTTAISEYYGDLMMLSEKKEGWVNVDKRSNGDVIISKPYPTRDEAIHNSSELTIDTVILSWNE